MEEGLSKTLDTILSGADLLLNSGNGTVTALTFMVLLLTMLVLFSAFIINTLLKTLTKDLKDNYNRTSAALTIITASLAYLSRDSIPPHLINTDELDRVRDRGE